METAQKPRSDRVVERPAQIRLVPKPSEACTAELAECTCPDFCERDHGNE